MSHKDYDAMVAEQLGERPTFTLGGQTFTCRLKLHWRKQSKIFLALANAEGDQVSEASVSFVRACLIPACREAFDALVAEPEDDEYEDDAAVVNRSQLNALMDDLFDYYAGKAETSDDGSSSSPASTGEPSNVVSLNSKES